MQANAQKSRTLNIETASTMLGISRPTGYKLARLDEFPVPVIRIGRRMVVSADAIEELLGRRKESGDAIQAA
jgi:predicted DNA-binding transcriptional regulator AlpA